MNKAVIILAVLGVATANYYQGFHHAPKPYHFGYKINDHTGGQYRQESGDGQSVRGSYGFTDARGIHRQVHYVADHNGYRAYVVTNEPGTANQNPANVAIHSTAPQYAVPQGFYYGPQQAVAPYGHNGYYG